ncbi:hypothetical protein VNO78_01070 [Psophocarpus tetragonolobus]|uniref:BAH domain-containing protein n=1 Tax=Psophocarpus tetragonolobus TaxID=3891 RepID=A0AAN9SXM7_PSOTE
MSSLQENTTNRKPSVLGMKKNKALVVRVALTCMDEVGDDKFEFVTIENYVNMGHENTMWAKFELEYLSLISKFHEYENMEKSRRYPLHFPRIFVRVLRSYCQVALLGAHRHRIGQFLSALQSNVTQHNPKALQISHTRIGYSRIENHANWFTGFLSFSPVFLCFWFSLSRRVSLVRQNMVEPGEEEVIEFKWGKQKAIGGRKKDVRFYDSFTYDGVEYFLFDSVFLYKEGEPEHYIGKIIKIWETSDKSRKVKILWYFRPSDIANFLEGSETLENELFLASGEGPGLVNVNPLEAISGKCNIVCISKDSRNPYPSNEEVQMAEFVFYRFFDVGKRTILDKIDDKIAGVEVKNIFNNLDSQKLVGLVKLGLDKKEVSGSPMESKEVIALLSQNNSQPLIEKPDNKCFDTLVSENTDSKLLLGEKLTCSTGVKEVSKPANALHTISNDKTAPQAKVEENGDCKDSLVKQKAYAKLSRGSRCGLEMREIARMDDGGGNRSVERSNLMSRVDSKRDDCEHVGVSIGQIKKGLNEEKAFKKEKHGSFGKISSVKMNYNGQNRRLITYYDDDDDNDDVKIIVPSSSSKDQYKGKRAMDSGDVEELPYKKLKIEKMPTKLTSDKFCKESSTISSNVEQKLDFRPMEVTPRPDEDRSKWFKEIPWEERIKTSYEQGKLVLLRNLDPSLSSSEIQVINIPILMDYVEN